MCIRDRVYTDILLACGSDAHTAKREYAAMKKSRNTSKPSTPTLDQYSRDLTQEARMGNMDPVIGRTKEIERVMQIPVSYTHLDVYKRQLDRRG